MSETKRAPTSDKLVEEAVVLVRGWLQSEELPADDLGDDAILEVVRRLATIASIQLLQARMLPGSWDKRFARHINEVPAHELTPRQLAMLAKLRHKYRGQFTGPAFRVGLVMAFRRVLDDQRRGTNRP